MKINQQGAADLMAIRAQLADIISSLEKGAPRSVASGATEIRIATEHLRFAIEEIDDALLAKR